MSVTDIWPPVSSLRSRTSVVGCGVDGIVCAPSGSLVADADGGHCRACSTMPRQELFISRTVITVLYHPYAVPRDATNAQAAPARALSRRAGFLLVQLGTHAHRRFADRLAELDLHPRHFGMLSHLAASEGQSQQALSIALGVHRSAVVALVDDLERRGLAERRPDPSDRRGAHALS